MVYRQQDPPEEIRDLVKSFWMIESHGEVASEMEKIIPDGYPELIFHYGAPYRSNISGKWSVQGKSLLAGQITHFFFLENTGRKGMLAVKLQPWAVRELFGLDMSRITDKVIDLPNKLLIQLDTIRELATGKRPFEEKVAGISSLLALLPPSVASHERGKSAIKAIIDAKGRIPLQTILQQSCISERSLERYCKSFIGLSPKFYSRIIRFANIFSLANALGFNWTDIAYLKGFYDQSHFIRNFKEFTGEEPSRYGFTEENMANFFLRSGGAKKR